MNRVKIVAVVITVALLVAVGIFVFRFIQGAIFSAARTLQQMGEAPLATEETDEKWVAPELPIDDSYDLEQGIDRVEVEDDADSREPEVDEDVRSVPVEKTADELAGTSPDVTPEADLPQ